MLKAFLACVVCASLVGFSFQAARAGGNTAVRDELLGVNAAWDEARRSFDVAAFERMLAPDFHVQMGNERLTRAQFIAEISTRRPGVELTRFDTRLLTLAPEDGHWVAVVEEKLEATLRGPDGTPRTSYSLWITRDRFRKQETGWVTLSSEAIGWETWSGGEQPPFDDWEE